MTNHPSVTDAHFCAKMISSSPNGEPTIVGRRGTRSSPQFCVAFEKEKLPADFYRIARYVNGNQTK